MTNARYYYVGHVWLAGVTIVPDPTLDDIDVKRSLSNRLLRRSAPVEAFQLVDKSGTTFTWRSQTIAEKINWIESIKALSSEQAPIVSAG